MQSKKQKRNKLTKEQIDVLRQAFNLFDTDDSGNIDFAELRNAMKALGFNASEEEVRQMAEKIDKNNSGFIEFDEFVMMMKTRMLEDKNVELEIERAFDYFDDDGDGSIDFEKFRRVAIDIGEDVSDEVIRDMIGAADFDQDGKVSKDEFMMVMRKMKLI
ncbi:hypothetical protein pb186bvf_018852 [Paramecium bursaria]